MELDIRTEDGRMFGRVECTATTLNDRAVVKIEGWYEKPGAGAYDLYALCQPSGSSWAFTRGATVHTARPLLRRKDKAAQPAEGAVKFAERWCFDVAVPAVVEAIQKQRIRVDPALV